MRSDARGIVYVPFCSPERRRHHEVEDCGNRDFCVSPALHRRSEFLPRKESPQTASTGQTARTSNTEPAPPRNPDRNAYFGEEHIHTSWSVDAWVIGNRLTGPDDALKFAQGQTIKHPMGYNITIDTPMDFMGVTDHSEYVGVTKESEHPGLGDQQDPGCTTFNFVGSQ